jgi:hypothetical protein
MGRIEYCSRCECAIGSEKIRIAVIFYPDQVEPVRPWRRGETPWPTALVCVPCFRRVTAELAGAIYRTGLERTPQETARPVEADPRERLKTLIRSALALVEAEERGSHSVSLPR